MSAALVESVKAWFSTVSVVFAAVRSISEVPRNQWETVKNQVGDLVSAATIATFLAAVQSQIIALSYQDNSTHLKTATNVLGFAGVLLDVTSACLGLMTSTVLQRHIAVVEKQLDAIEDASPEQLQETLRFLEASRTRGQLLASLLSSSAFPDLLRRILAKVMARAAVLEKQNTDGDGGELNPLTESTGFRIEAVPNPSIGGAASGAMLLGVLCFFGSVICLAVSTQPHVVWIIAVALTGGIFVAASSVRAVGRETIAAILTAWAGL
ncbi:hypothetical protein B0H13DRAFT_2442400 [Mycena leptocephala]|nr:hypothetical protein B0H13DRAFT_2442400 [Mycena leptocephala]